jgi:hypothetical protein
MSQANAVRILFEIDGHRYIVDTPCDASISNDENMSKAVEQFAQRIDTGRFLPCNEMTLEMEAIRSMTVFINTENIKVLRVITVAVIDAKYTYAPKQEEK